MTEKLRTYLPLVGIVSFSLCSAWALFNLFNGNAQHPTWLYALPAVLVELVAAAAIHALVERYKLLTLSKQSQQDRRFNLGITGALLVLAIIPLGVSTWANSVELGGIVLGLVFPVCTVTCALLAAIPHAVETYQKRREAEKETDRKQAEARRLEKEARRMQAEMDRRQAEMDRIQQEKEAEARRKFLESLGNAGRTLALYQEHPGATQQDIAEMAGVTPRTIRAHLNQLEQAGLVKRNGHGLEVV